MELRVRANKAYFTVPCSDNELHSVVLSLDGEAQSRFGSHNFEEERVIEILGGEPSACAKIHKVYDAALVVFKAKYGIKDPDGLTKLSRDDYWKSEESCSSCSLMSGRVSNSTIKHYASIVHQSEINGLSNYQGLIKRLVQWFERNELFGMSSSSLLFQDSQSYFNSYISMRGISVRSAMMITPAFVSVAEVFVGQKAKEILALRKVYTIQRLQQILEEVGERKVVAIRNKMALRRSNEKTLGSMLIANRTVPTYVLIDFLQAGIYANIYTYYKNDATAHQALRVYTASNGTKTLKQYLAEGVSPMDAVLLAESN